MRLSHGAWFHVDGRGRRTAKWTRLGSTYAEALLAYAKLEAAQHDRRDVSALLDAFIGQPGKAATTVRNYKLFRRRLDSVFGHMPPDALTAQDARRYLDAHPRASMARHEISLLSAAMQWGYERGWSATNPLRGMVKGKRERRLRYITDAELAAILTHARPDVALAVELLHLTALRVRDALALRWSDYKAGVLRAKVHKTRTAIDLEGPALDDLLRRMRSRSVVSLHICTGSGRPLSYDILRRHFKAAAAAAGCPDVTVHDLRRKRLTDLTNAQGEAAAQRLAAHSDVRTTRGYYADVPRVKI